MKQKKKKKLSKEKYIEKKKKQITLEEETKKSYSSYFGNYSDSTNPYRYQAQSRRKKRGG
eukprot:TRINITY_DN803_c0_g1_i1.p2 TRINITY_DN803_c0_g1~~TRINITY_DN803_c0_g1_i1.p2  ORF type:complete len:60 (+),score=19.37 TRINITY_DN803_c0_g1_i1:287-466(+)